MYQTILDCAQQQNKNILIIGSPRSGTHALSAELCKLGRGKSLMEICKTGYCNDPWDDINRLSSSARLTTAQVVQLTPKLVLAENVDKIKKDNIIVNIRRRDKVLQFASWIYFRVSDPTALHGWHNHNANKTRVQPGSVTAAESDIVQFKLEQLLDDYFLPTFNLCYEDLTFTQTNFRKNTFAFHLPKMFSNLDYVKQQLETWQYSTGHFDNE
jgi:hypothetical protein